MNHLQIPRYHLFEANHFNGGIHLLSHYHSDSVHLQYANEPGECDILSTAIPHLLKCGYNISGICNSIDKKVKYILSDTFENKPLNI